MKKAVVYILMVFALGIFLAGCGGREEKRKAESIPVRVMEVKPMDMARMLDYVGTVKGQNEALVYPKVDGKIVEKVEEGSPVNKGDAVAFIDRDEVGLKFEKAPVESPLAGVVGRVYVDIGANVTTTTPIALVSDMKGTEINISIPEKYLPEISLGQNALIEVDAYPGVTFTGSLTEMSPVVDVDTRSAPLEITIDDKENKLRSGMFARVRLILKENKGVPVILKEAVVGKGEDTYVYTVEGNTARFKKIRLGIREGAYYQVVEGLNTGELVVIMGQQLLRDGATVTVESEEGWVK